MYFLIDKSDLAVILSTWSITEIPPNPSKNAHKIIFIEMFLQATLQTSDIPFVSSIIPEIIELAKEISTLKILRIGCNRSESACNILLLFKIEIITENITTNPPIIIIVLLESIIAFESISPKFENVHNCLLGVFLELYELKSYLELVLFLLWTLETRPNIIPTVNADKICVISNNNPIEEFENKVIPNSSKYK